MKVYLEPMYGDPESNVERAKIQLAKALGFRGSIIETKVKGRYIMAEIKISTRWELPPRRPLKSTRRCLHESKS